MTSRSLVTSPTAPLPAKSTHPPPYPNHSMTSRSPIALPTASPLSANSTYQPPNPNHYMTSRPLVSNTSMTSRSPVILPTAPLPTKSTHPSPDPIPSMMLRPPVSLPTVHPLPANSTHPPPKPDSSMTSLPSVNYIIIGLSGVSGGGKTTLVARLMAQLGKTARVETLRLDEYFWKDKSRLPFNAALNHLDYERPDCIDFDRYYADVMSIVQRFAQNSQAKAPQQILILDGFLLFVDVRIVSLCHLKYDFSLPYLVARQRRERRFYAHPDKAGYFDQAVWPGHLEYRQIVDLIRTRREIVTVDGNETAERIFVKVFSDFQRFVEKKCPSVSYNLDVKRRKEEVEEEEKHVPTVTVPN